MNRLDTIVHSAGFYPITGLYLAGVGLGLLVAKGALSVALAVLTFALVAIGAILLAAFREIRAVHLLVNGQRHDLVARIDELNSLLVKAGIGVPPAGPNERAATEDDREEPPA